MSPPCPQRARFLRNWFEHWSPAERAIVALLSLLVFVTLIVGLRAWSWLAGIFALAAFIALQIVAFRHGGSDPPWRHLSYRILPLSPPSRRPPPPPPPPPHPFS